MDNLGIKEIRKDYVDELIKYGDFEKADKLAERKTDTPLFTGYEVHPEVEPSLDEITDQIADISLDIASLNYEMYTASKKCEELMETINSRLDSIQEKLLAEEDRIKDMNIVCGNYDEFVSVKALGEKDFGGSFKCSGDVFRAKSKDETEAVMSVLQVMGNGYEGNSYVITDKQDSDGNYKYQKDNEDTSVRNNMVDGSYLTCYEYSRLTSTGENDYPTDVNIDNLPAECGIMLFASENICSLNLISDQPSLVVKDVLTSSDHGATFQSVMSGDPVSINNMNDAYHDDSYVYGSGIISIPNSQYIKLILQSDNIANDKIAYTTIDTSNAEQPIKTQKLLENTKRRFIRINEISGIAGHYESESTMVTDELVSSPMKSIALFANEYLPDHYPPNQDYIEYVLTVNGIDYDIVPINCTRAGKKILRNAAYSLTDNYVIGLDEPVKSAVLTIKIYSYDGISTPYVGNIKLCFGKAVTK